MSKIIKSIIIVLAILFILIFIAFSILFIKYGFKLKEIFSITISDNLIYEEEYETVKKIDVTFNYCNVLIRESDNNKYKIELFADNEKEYSVKYENDEFSINYKDYHEGFINSILHNKRSLIVVHIPSDYKNNINITGNVGSININNFPLAKANITLNTGNIKIDEVSDLTATLNAGDIDIKKIDKYINVELSTGDVEIEKLNITKNSTINVNVGEVEIDKANDLKIEASTRVGSVSIKNSNTGNRKLTIKVDVGDITIDDKDILSDIHNIKDLDSYKKINIDKVKNVDIIRYTVGGDSKVTFEDDTDIKRYYDMIGNITIGKETNMVCEDNTTVYKFNMDNESVSFTFECEWLILNGRRYLVK